MTDDSDHKLATLEERSKNQKERIQKLENNQRWGVLAILSLVGKAMLDFFGKGGT